MPTTATPNAPLGRRATARSPAIGRARRRGAATASTVGAETVIVTSRSAGLDAYPGIEEPVREVRE